MDSSLNCKHTFTPGPWFSHKAPSIHGGNLFVIQNADRNISLATLVPGSNTDRVEPVAALNAQLMATSPELLSVCEDMLDALEVGKIDGGDVFWLPCNSDVMNALRDVVRKARG